MASWVLAFILARPFFSSIFSRWRRAFLFSLASRDTGKGRDESKAANRRIVGRLCQSPFEIGVSPAFARSYRVAGRDALQFSAAL